MNQSGMDIWFGPGGLKGAFGAGVAHGLHEAIGGGQLDPRQLRLFGSSVGCLNAAFLATGNAACGLDVYQEDVSGLIRIANLLPSIAARMADRIRRAFGKTTGFPIPCVLNVDHVFQVMARRTPEIAKELKHSSIPVFAELLDSQTAKFRHIDLRGTDDPLSVIRSALNCFPFVCSDEKSALDSSIKGYGVVDLINTSGRRLVVVLNDPRGRAIRDVISGVACAVLAASPRVSRLYLDSDKRRRRAIKLIEQQPMRALLVCPQRPIRSKRAADLAKAYRSGTAAAQRIVDFAGGGCRVDSRVDSGLRSLAREGEENQR